MHAFVEVHVTPSKEVSGEPVGLGVCTIDHLFPFQRSASVPIALLSWEPTAVHRFAEAHHTATSSLETEPGEGVFRSDHLFPFHRSPSVRFPLPLLYWPTAVQAVGAVQETPWSWLNVAPDGLGLRWTVQPEAAATAVAAITSAKSAPPAMEILLLTALR